MVDQWLVTRPAWYVLYTVHIVRGVRCDAAWYTQLRNCCPFMTSLATLCEMGLHLTWSDMKRMAVCKVLTTHNAGSILHSIGPVAIAANWHTCKPETHRFTHYAGTVQPHAADKALQHPELQLRCLPFAAVHISAPRPCGLAILLDPRLEAWAMPDRYSVHVALTHHPKLSAALTAVPQYLSSSLSTAVWCAAS